MRRVAASSSRCWIPSLSFVSIVGGAAFFSAFFSTSAPTSLSGFVCAQSSYGPATGASPANASNPSDSGAAPSTNASNPPAGSPPANAPNAPDSAAGPSANAPKSSEPEKTVASETLATLFQAPAASGSPVGGVPLSLEKLLFGVSSPFERNRRVLGYWNLSEKYAEHNNCAQCAALANQCVDRIVKKYGSVASIPAESRAAAAASQRVAKERAEAARLAFFKAQLDFDAAFSSAAARRAAILAAKSGETGAASENSPNGAGSASSASELAAKGTLLYVPTAVPTTLKYNARFAELSRQRRLSREAARLNVALPLLYQALENRALQARQAFSNLTVAFAAAQPDEGILFNLLDRYASARAELLSVAIRYNRTIALYVAETGPGRVGSDLYLAMLKQKTFPDAVASASVPKTFAVDEPSQAVAAANAGENVVGNGVRSTSYAEGAATSADLTPTPGVRFEPADVPASPSPLAETSSNSAVDSNGVAASEPSASAEPLPETPKPSAESDSSPASSPEQASPSPTSEPVPPSSAPPTDAKPVPPAAESPSESAGAVSASVVRPSAIILAEYRQKRDAVAPTPSSADFEDSPIIRGQAPAAASPSPSNLPQNPASAATPSGTAPPQNQPASSQNTAQNSPSAAPNDAVQKRVRETTEALFATKPESASVDEPIAETPVSFREALARVPATPETRGAVLRAYWLLSANCARLAVERALFAAYSQAIDAFNAKLNEQKKAGSEPDPAFVATAGAYLAAAREAQARVAEARLLKRESQLDLSRLTARPIDAGWPVPSTLPFCGPSFEFETPRIANAVVVRERALIPEKLNIVRKIGAEFGPPATLFSPEVPSVLDGNPFVSLTTFEKKREAALLFIELVVSLNVSTGDYVANFPAGYVSPDRFAKALVGEEK